MPSITKVLKRNGVPYIYNPEATELTEEEAALPQEGDWVEVTNGKSVIRHEWHEPIVDVEPEQTPVFPISDLVVTANGNVAGKALTGDFVAGINETVVINCQLVNGAAVSYPGAVIKMPIVRHADGRATDDEIYFSVTIVGGVLNASGNIPRSGDWKLLTSRINKALARINAGWELEANDIGFLI